MVTCLCHQNGIMECWNIGIRAEINHFNCKKLLQTHHSITPLFQHSNWGEAPNLNIFSIPKNFYAFKSGRTFEKLCLTFRSLFSKGSSNYNIVSRFYTIKLTPRPSPSKGKASKWIFLGYPNFWQG